jgi:RNA polymerase sigma factor (sigma-70 family)
MRHSQMGQQALTDAVRLAAAGDQEAWNTIVDQFGPLLWHVVNGYRLDHQQCADAVQETWIQLVRHIDRIQDPARLPGWLVTTTRNHCLAIIRRNQKERALGERCEQMSDESPGPEEQVLQFERREHVRQALRRLSSGDQELLGLVAASPPVSYREISRRLGIPIGSIGPTRQRALERLRRQLESEYAH